MLKIIESRGDDELARVFVGELSDGTLIEFAEAVQPPLPREEKWVLIVSTLRGCPISCPICDAGGDYRGRLSAEEMLDQIAHLIHSRFAGRTVAIPKLKVQFARMGDPAFNPAVLEVLERLPHEWDAPGLMPCISTIAPRGCDAFFEELLGIKNRRYPGGRFQLQLSLHSTSEEARQLLIPARTWSFAEMAAYGGRFFAPGDRKLTLNFAPARGLPLDPAALRRVFSPELFLVKLTPINPTLASSRSGLSGLIDPQQPAASEEIAESFRRVGFETLLSIGELDENRIGSNCGMCVRALHEARSADRGARALHPC